MQIVGRRMCRQRIKRLDHKGDSLNNRRAL